MIDIHKILHYLPHRYPFLLIDRITHLEAGKTVTGLKNVTINEPYFAGHFPENPVVPGVIMLEAMAQTAGLLAFVTQGHENPRDVLYFFAGVDNARFKHVVSPGDQMLLHMAIERGRQDVWRFNGKVMVGDNLACSADIMLAGEKIKMIDARAIIDPGAKLAADVSVGPYTIIGSDVEIGEGSWIGPHAVIKGPAKIGKNNKVYQFASVGEDPQDKKYQGEKTFLEIGDNNVIRESCTINRGTIQAGGTTKIGSNNLLMAYVHIAHDCQIANDTILANNTSLAGHVTVENFAILSGFVLVHQFCVIGQHSFVAAATGIGKDVLPYLMVSGYGHEVNSYGLNTEGLRRRGFTEEKINQLKRAYKIIFRQNLTVPQAIEQLEEMKIECPEVQLFITALQSTTRGIIR